MSDTIENLKIIVNNETSSAAEMDQSETNVLDLNADDSEKMIVIDNNTNDETEFHVNLDKVPITLKQTLTKEKLYYNTIEQDDTIEDIKMVNSEQLEEICKSLEINQDDLSGYLRAEALTIFGVDDMNTEDIFAFFLGYKPTAIEWINDSKCNVVWKDKNLAALSLLELTKACNENELNEFFSQLDKSSEKPNEDESDEAEKTGKPKYKEEIIELFKQDKYRLSTRKAKNNLFLFMRYAKPSDRKIKGAEARSKYYVKHGNPNYGNLKGLISNSKRKKFKRESFNSSKNELDFDEDDLNDSNEPREAPQDSNKKSIHSRLSHRRSLDNNYSGKRKMKMYSDVFDESNSGDEDRKRFKRSETEGNTRANDLRRDLERRRQKSESQTIDLRHKLKSSK